MTKTEINNKVICFWPDDSMENPLIVEDGTDVVILHQQTDTIYLNKEYIPELIKTLKQYIK